MVQEHVVREAYKMLFDIGTIKHLGLQMYSTLPPVIGELVSNAWDADATRVDITIPTTAIDDHSEIVVKDNGTGMSDENIRKAYLVVGRDRREDDKTDVTGGYHRKVMGRKGIGKFSAFGIADKIEVESVHNGETSRFILSYSALKDEAKEREITLPCLNPTNTISEGSKIILRSLKKYKNRTISILAMRRGLARRFSIIGEKYNFEVVINGKPITPEERDLQRLLDKDIAGNEYIWKYENKEIKPETGWYVSGWIGTLSRTNPLEDGIQRGIAVMARGKLVQEPFVFDAVVGQQYALSYIVGELYAEFVDEKEDTIGTTRNSLVWDTEANTAFKKWGQEEVNRVAREWSVKRKASNEAELVKNPVYIKFNEEAEQLGNKRARKIADKLIREIITRDPIADVQTQEPVIQMCLDFLEFDAFWDLAQDLTETKSQDTEKLLQLFREWEVVEAKEMMRVTEGRIATIQKLEQLITANTLEVPTLHNFLKEFPWVLDPRWTLIADEKTYSQILREQFPDSDKPENDRRIDFLCVKESVNLIVVEIKRPHLKASVKELEQIEEYVSFMRNHIKKTNDPQLGYRDVTGYLLCGGLVDHWKVDGKRDNLEKSGIYIRLYSDLLRMVKENHSSFLARYEQLRKQKNSK